MRIAHCALKVWAILLFRTTTRKFLPFLTDSADSVTSPCENILRISEHDEFYPILRHAEECRSNLHSPTNPPSIQQHEVMVKTPLESENNWSIQKRSKFKKPTTTVKDKLPADRMYNATQTLNGRVPPDVRETCRDMLYYLRKRPELLKKPSPRGFKVSTSWFSFRFFSLLAGISKFRFGHHHNLDFAKFSMQV